VKREREHGFLLLFLLPNRIAFEGDDPTVISDLVSQGLGVAFVSELSWVPKSGEFPHKLRIVEPACPRTIGLAWSEKRYFTPIAKQFRLFVLEYFLID